MAKMITSLIEKKIYPIIANALDKNSNKFKDNIAKFLNKNHEILYASAPYDPIYWNQIDKDNMYNIFYLLLHSIMKTDASNIFLIISKSSSL